MIYSWTILLLPMRRKTRYSWGAKLTAMLSFHGTNISSGKFLTPKDNLQCPSWAPNLRLFMCCSQVHLEGPFEVRRNRRIFNLFIFLGIVIVNLNAETGSSFMPHADNIEGQAIWGSVLEGTNKSSHFLFISLFPLGKAADEKDVMCFFCIHTLPFFT